MLATLLAFTGCTSAPAVVPTATLSPSPRSVPTLPAVATMVITATQPPSPTVPPTQPPSPTVPPTQPPSPTVPPTQPPSPTVPPTQLPSPTMTATPKGLAPAERMALFEEVWNKVNTHYLYPDFHGVNWQAVHDEFIERVTTVESDDQFYALMTEMVGRLNDEHSRFLPPSAAEEEDVLSTGFEEQVGIGIVAVATLDGALIQHVFPNSPADEAGLRSRDRIVAVDGAFVTSGGDIQGAAGTQVRLTVVRPGSQILDVVLTRRQVEGRISPKVRRLDNDIGYLAVTTLWVQDMPDQTRAALETLIGDRPLRGLIIDLRGNPGGWQPVLLGLLSHFVRGETGFFFDQRSAKPLVVEEGAGLDLRGMPLAVLIDGNTASYAELLAGVLQREAGAVVVGLPSAGNTETIYAYELAGGARLWVAQEGFRLRDGTNLEDHGVQPDVIVNVDWTRFSEDEDPMTLEALRQIQLRMGMKIPERIAGGRR